MKNLIAKSTSVVVVVIAMIAGPATALEYSRYHKDKPPATGDHTGQMLITNVSIFNGTSGKLITAGRSC